MGETLRILLLEDVPSDAELMEIELRQAGIRFVALRVETEPEFRQALADFQPDLILADYTLPSFNALEALRIVNQQSPGGGGVPFILVTGNQSEEIAVRVMKEGAHDYLLKSSLTRLPSAVRNALDRKVAHQAKLQAEKALRESEEKYRSVFNNFIDLYYQTDMQGLITNLSPSCFILSGWKPEELIGHQVLELYPDPEQRKTLLEKLHREGAVSDYEITLLHRDGRHLSVSVSSHLIRDEQGNPKYVEGTIRDITERKQAEDALRYAYWRLESIIEGTHVGTWEWNVQTGETFFNEVWAQIIGYTLDELAPISIKTWETFAHPDDLKQSAELLERHSAGELPYYDYECRVKHKDGHWVWVHDRGRVITRTGDGKPLMMFGTRTDVTERKRAEEVLAQVAREWQTTFDAANDMIWLLDKEQRVLRSNKTSERFFQRPCGELVGIHCWEIVHGMSEPIPECPILRARKSLRRETMELQIGKGWFVVTVDPILDATGQYAGAVHIVSEITERKQAEERIRQVRSDLLFAVSHDLKTPLQALNQSQEMLNALAPGEGLARFQEYQQIWRRNLQRLERMINNLVDSQRGEEDRFSLLLAPCDPTEMVKRVAEDSQGYAQTNQVTLDLKLEPVPEGSCDEEALARVVENLLTNAFKFSPKGGHIEVCLQMEDQTLLLEVEDHGLGIPANEQDQLFQPFQRGRSAQRKGIPGTGLGLYVCRRIVEEHGGTIALESELGKGTKVIVRLPWKKGAE